MKFDTAKFYRFCRYLQIDTKEQGRIRLGDHLKGTQHYLFQQIAAGLQDDIHFFVALKGRQAMITTAMEALDLYWLFKYPGLQGTLVTDTDDNKAKCRSELSLFMESLPDKWRIDAATHNRTLLELENRSRLFYQTAGTRGNKFLGQGKGINFSHGTEVGSWGSEEGVMSLLASFAQNHPNRLFVFESTAHGFNYFEDMWQTAKRAKAQRAIFIGWWRNEMYQIPKESPLFHHYWDGRPTGEEKEWMKEIYSKFDYKITAPQLAWWRQRASEEFTDMQILYQNHPPCVTAETRVGTDRGLIRIDQARNGMQATKGLVVNTHANQPAQIYKIRTSMGYELRGTADHPIFSAGGILILMSESLGQKIQLCAPRLASDEYVFHWKEGVLESHIRITEEFARFVGIFMGDGSFSIKNTSRSPHSGCGTLSIACAKKDEDFIDLCMQMIRRLFDIEPTLRQPSEGGVEIRASSTFLTQIFKRLNLVHNNYGPTRRHIHVPEFIFQSPKLVVRAFLQGIFETDGYNSHHRIVLCSKHREFMHDVQLLLLAFGITGRLVTRPAQTKVRGVMHKYTANLIETRTCETAVFNREIGFLSARKIANSVRQKPLKIKNPSPPKPITLEDIVISVEKDGVESVYNLTIEGEHAFDANGIHTHNTESYAFIAAGKLFFSNAGLTDSIKRAKRASAETYRFTFGAVFADTKLVRATERMAQLTIWERPHSDGVYAIGADPAYGSSEYADRFAIQVLRCYADGVDQVAEFACSSVESYQFAWIIAALAGLYRYARVNLEMNSCGGAVYNELKNLKRQVIAMPPSTNRQELFDVVSAMRFFMWQADDNISGPTNSIGWLTNEKNKASMLYSFRDMFELKRMTVNSVELLEEMRTLEQVEGSIAAEGRNKDDRVMAMGLAIACYVKKIIPSLLARQLTREKQKSKDARGENPQQDALDATVGHYLTRIGLNLAKPAR